MKAFTALKALAVAGFLIFLVLTHKTKYDYFRGAAITHGLLPISPCRTVKLNDGRHVYLRGFSAWEGSFRWTGGTRGYIFFVLPMAMTGREVRIRLKVTTVAADYVHFSMHGMDSDGVGMERGDGRTLILHGEKKRSGSNKLVALVLDVDTPRRGSIRDKRWLGAAVSSLSVCLMDDDVS